MPSTAPTHAASGPTRPGPLDIALTVLVSAIGLAFAYFNHVDGATNAADQGGPVDVSVWAIPAFLIITLPMLWRSISPLAALGGVIGGLLVYAAAIGSIVQCGITYPIIALLAYAAASKLQGRDRLLGLLLVVAAVLVEGFTDHLGPGTIVVGMPLALLAFGGGLAMAALRDRRASAAPRVGTPAAA